jgi:serine protease Do
MRLFSFLTLLFLLIDPVAGQGPQVETLQEQTRTVIAKVEKSVVSLVVSTTNYPNQIAADVQAGKLGGYIPPANATSRDPLDLSALDNAMNSTTGNGIVLTAEGLILTPYHLLEGATKIYVHIGGKGSYADIHAADARSDLAVLRMLEPPAGLMPAVMTKSPLGKPVINKGDFAIAISGPAGEAPAASLGLVAATDKKIIIPIEPSFSGIPPAQPLVAHPTLLQIDARTGRGTSGGGVFNLKGELIGLTTALAVVSGSDQAPGYAMPMDSLYRPIVAALREGREVEYGFLGISWSGNRGFGRRFAAPDPFPARMSNGGIVVQMVTPGMPAAEAGLEAGDELLGVNGAALTGQDEMQFRIAAALANVETKLTVRRNGRNVETIPVVLAKANNTFPWIASKRPAPVFGLRVDQLSTLIQDLVGKESHPRFIETIPRGVVISEIESGSPADKAFKEQNRKFVVTKVNGLTVRTPDDFYSAARVAARIKLTVARVGDTGSRPFEVTLP